MSGSSAMPAIDQLTVDSKGNQLRKIPISLARSAGTYDVLVANEDMLIKRDNTYVSQGASGVTSVSIQSNCAVPDVVLGSTLLVNLILGKNLAALGSSFILPAGKKIQVSIVGIGSAGELMLFIEYGCPVAGALV